MNNFAFLEILVVVIHLVVYSFNKYLQNACYITTTIFMECTTCTQLKNSTGIFSNRFPPFLDPGRFFIASAFRYQGQMRAGMAIRRVSSLNSGDQIPINYKVQPQPQLLLSLTRPSYNYVSSKERHTSKQPCRTMLVSFT